MSQQPSISLILQRAFSATYRVHNDSKRKLCSSQSLAALAKYHANYCSGDDDDDDYHHYDTAAADEDDDDANDHDGDCDNNVKNEYNEDNVDDDDNDNDQS